MLFKKIQKKRRNIGGTHSRDKHFCGGRGGGGATGERGVDTSVVDEQITKNEKMGQELLGEIPNKTGILELTA